MTRWTHSICDLCWNVLNPDREPVHFLSGITAGILLSTLIAWIMLSL